ncbi:unnamed protein product [Microthlaspi erraticum]|uniref:NYN domain-containing protein n=1 Tax=Microthlaspi erraticum TaxID=1685480 RepID=A0A6D2HDZ8_9BRAS|nr:unnamed protein product [Microthlaspi erraticum]
MSSLSSKFSVAKTGVFWDLDGCPIPAGLGPVAISANIKLALENMGYTGNISISAYSAEQQSQQVESEFESAHIKLQHRGTRQETDNLMYLDVMFWGVDHKSEATNVMLISKHLYRNADFVSGLVQLKEKENNILLVHLYNPGGLPLRDTATSTWVWKSLATGGTPLVGHCTRPQPPTPSPPSPCSVRTTTTRALRLANKPKKRLPKLRLKRRKTSRAIPAPED